MKRLLLSIILTISFASVVSAQSVCSRFRAEPGQCDLNAAPREQAKCLLRPVKKFANLGEPLRELPGSLDWLVGQPVDGIFIEQLKILLEANGIAEADLGGSLSVPLPDAKYFVIHDTSDLLEASEFPSDINSKSASLNDLSRWLAFIYVAASLRAGKWLIPAYHSPLDLGFPDRHDDPQNFNLEYWAMSVAAIIAVGGHIH